MVIFRLDNPFGLRTNPDLRKVACCLPQRLTVCVDIAGLITAQHRSYSCSAQRPFVVCLPGIVIIRDVNSRDWEFPVWDRPRRRVGLQGRVKGSRQMAADGSE